MPNTRTGGNIQHFSETCQDYWFRQTLSIRLRMRVSAAMDWEI
jgi:hypothetical protein